MIWPFKREPKYKIVTDGQDFAIKRRDGRFLDLTSFEHWWAPDGRYFLKCWTHDRNKLEKFLRMLEA